ncbi:MAG: kelch repeat-containing protein [Alphaproteobacteria bacterium]
MSKSAAAMLVLVFLIASCIIIAKSAVSSADVGSDYWVSKTPMHEARGRLGVAVVNGKIYAIGGDGGGLYGAAYGAMLDYTNVTEEYDPATDMWAFKASMPTPRGHFGIAVYRNKIYCIGGFNNNGDTGANEVYNPATDTWESKEPMPVPRSSVTANIVNGRIYVISAPYNSSSNYVYDPETDSWETKTPPPYEITSYASAVFDNKIYFIATDYTASGLWSEPFIQIYDAVNENWSIGAYAPTYGINAVAAATTGVNAPKRIYFFDETGTQVYDPTNDRWTVGASMRTLRSNTGVALVNDLFYAVGGEFLPPSNSLFANITTSAVNEQYVPIGYGAPDPSYAPLNDSAAPAISVLSPENRTYSTTGISLTFTIDEPASWIRYKLDDKTVAEIEGNTTLPELSCGSHNLKVYVTDAAGNTRASETITFTISKSEPFPVAPVAAASGLSVVVVGVALWVYFKRRNR